LGVKNATRNDPVLLTPQMRRVVEAAIAEVCTHRGWDLSAVNARTNHVHAVVGRADAEPERVLQDLKSGGTRKLRESGLIARNVHPWTRHGSTIYIWDADMLMEKIDYVLNQQDDPARWVQQRGTDSA
jgi:REP element-mobilizing transposase RayT